MYSVHTYLQVKLRHQALGSISWQGLVTSFLFESSDFVELQRMVSSCTLYTSCSKQLERYLGLYDIVFCIVYVYIAIAKTGIVRI